MTLQDVLAFNGLFGAPFTCTIMLFVIRPMIQLHKSHVERLNRMEEERHEYLERVKDNNFADLLKAFCVDVNNALFNAYDMSSHIHGYGSGLGGQPLSARFEINSSIQRATFNNYYM
ncbi:hypothetical protein PODOV084v1_p0012 [Vibrio phage 340E47.2]|nr:hypothetical protein PODOV084v1_p0012 [Vibrio phage 340E47.2]QZI91916.1 hypothetical protein PODOV077v1_p0005 [Vibrio phage 5P1a]